MIAWPRLSRRMLLWATGAAVVAPRSPAAAAAAGLQRGAQIWTSAFAGTRVWGYVDKHSVAPGEGLDLMLSTGPEISGVKGRVEFFRIGNDPGGQRLVWRSGPVEVPQQPASRTAASVGPNWTPLIRDIDTAAWPPGYYTADFVADGTGIRDLQIVQLVVLNPRRDGAVLLRLGTNTYQAYNAWGGHSLYPSEGDEARGAMVSFDRPGLPMFFTYDVYLARWLEALGARRGFAVDYASNFDLHRHPGMADRYPLVAFGAHDEYWSKEEFDAVEGRIFRAGKNTIFFGGNAAYWQVRYVDVNRPPGGDDRGRQLLCYKSLTDPIARRAPAADRDLLVTARFRDGARRPETMLMGVAYQNWFPEEGERGARYPYLVERTDLPFFEGTGWHAGDAVGDVVGYEWDDRDPDGDGRRLWDPSHSRNPSLPAGDIKVLFRGRPVAADGKPGRAEAVYFTSPAGAQVFAAGSIRWAWGLGKPDFVQDRFQRFNENLVTSFIGL